MPDEDTWLISCTHGNRWVHLLLSHIIIKNNTVIQFKQLKQSNQENEKEVSFTLHEGDESEADRDYLRKSSWLIRCQRQRD